MTTTRKPSQAEKREAGYRQFVETEKARVQEIAQGLPEDARRAYLATNSWLFDEQQVESFLAECRQADRA